MEINNIYAYIFRRPRQKTLGVLEAKKRRKAGTLGEIKPLEYSERTRGIRAARITKFEDFIKIVFIGA
ncbi:MAG: hypothetical protein LBV69_08235 [Bacteroidales bacterium]|jgi:hypothetical protein|nr:hypothetical protein [Bacteroidales bacterium]